VPGRTGYYNLAVSIDPAALLVGAIALGVTVIWVGVAVFRSLVNPRRSRSSRAAAKRSAASVSAGAVAQPAVLPYTAVSSGRVETVAAGTSPAAPAVGFSPVEFTARTVAALRRRWQRFRRTRTRRQVITRVWDGTSDYFGGLFQSDYSVKRPFVLGLAAAWTYRWNQAIEHFQEAKARASEAQAVPLLNHIGMCRRIQGNPDRALSDFSESARIAARHGDDKGRAAALCNIGVIRHDYGELNRALRPLREALAASRAAGDERAARICLANIGNILRDKGRFGDALKSHHEALAIAERIGDGPGMADCLGSIAGVLRELDDLDQAQEYYSRAIKESDQIRYDIGVAVNLSGLAGVHFDKGELGRALELHEKALATSRRIGYRLGTAAGRGNIGLTLVKQAQYEDALPHLAESLTLFQAIGVSAGTAQVLSGLARCDEVLGRRRLRELLRQALPTDELSDGILGRVDRKRHRRPLQKTTQPAG
jgi:tetratricopeptide (TPR) repeat protein